MHVWHMSCCMGSRHMVCVPKRAKQFMSLLSSVRVSSLVIAGFLSLIGCGAEEELPHRCGPQLPGETCQTQHPNDTAGSSAAPARDAGTMHATKPNLDERRSERQDAGTPPEDEFVSTPQCRAPTFFFSPACATRSFNPEFVPTQIAPGCYRPCMQARDAICASGTRCGRAGIAPRVCSGTTCASICAEAWLCLPNSYFPSEVGDDAGTDSWPDSDAGRLDPPLIDDAGI